MGDASQCLASCGFCANAGLGGSCSRCAQAAAADRQATALQLVAGGGCVAAAPIAAPEARPLDGDAADNAWRNACLGAALDDAVVVQHYLAGASAGAADRRVTDAEREALKEHGIWIDTGATLLDLALERDSIAVVSLLTEGPSDGMAEDDVSHLLRRRLSSLDDVLQPTTSITVPFGLEGLSLPQRVREALSETRRVRSDGLCYLDLPAASCALVFTLPAAVAGATPEMRKQALGLLVEAHDCLQALEVAVGWWPEQGASLVVPLYTSADLNCLLHACGLTLAGVRDTLPAPGPDGRKLLRDMVHESLLSCEPLRAAVADALAPPLAQEARTTAAASRLTEILSLAKQDRTALDGAHVFCLAQVLRRPLVCYAPPEHEAGEARHALSVPFRVSGVYLPLLWPPHECSPDPLLLAYTRGHFTGLCPVEPGAGAANSGHVVVPLFDVQGAPLPVPFAAAAAGAEPPTAEAGSPAAGRNDAWMGWAGPPPASATGAPAPSRECGELLRRYLRLTSLPGGAATFLRSPLATGAAEAATAANAAAARPLDGEVGEDSQMGTEGERAVTVLAKYRQVVSDSVRARLTGR